MQSTSDLDRIVRPREAAIMLGVCRATLYNLVATGLLEKPEPVGVKSGVGWPVSALARYRERRATERQATAEQRATEEQARASRAADYKVVADQRAAARAVKRAAKSAPAAT